LLVRTNVSFLKMLLDYCTIISPIHGFVAKIAIAGNRVQKFFAKFAGRYLKVQARDRKLNFAEVVKF
jgi:hypothetical protein